MLSSNKRDNRYNFDILHQKAVSNTHTCLKQMTSGRSETFGIQQRFKIILAETIASIGFGQQIGLQPCY